MLLRIREPMTSQGLMMLSGVGMQVLLTPRRSGS